MDGFDPPYYPDLPGWQPAFNNNVHGDFQRISSSFGPEECIWRKPLPEYPQGPQQFAREESFMPLAARAPLGQIQANITAVHYSFQDREHVRPSLELQLRPRHTHARGTSATSRVPRIEMIQPTCAMIACLIWEFPLPDSSSPFIIICIYPAALLERGSTHEVV